MGTGAGGTTGAELEMGCTDSGSAVDGAAAVVLEGFSFDGAALGFEPASACVARAGSGDRRFGDLDRPLADDLSGSFFGGGDFERALPADAREGPAGCLPRGGGERDRERRANDDIESSRRSGSLD